VEDKAASPISGNGMHGLGQAHEGIAQGHIGSVAGQMAGANEGIDRAAMGEMEPNALTDLLKRYFPGFSSSLFGDSDMGKPMKPIPPVGPP
jgi:hypothetical protein